MNKVNVGFIGVGGIANVHLKNIAKNEEANLVAVCDINEENAIRVANDYDVAWYTEADELLEKEQIDALFVCVPPFAHGEIEEKAAKRGIHLMVEKPLALDMDTVQRKYEAMKHAGIICASGYCLRYLDTVKIAKEYLQDKEIAMVRGHYISSFVPTPWYREMDKSGGQLVEQATHTMDLMRYFAGDIDAVHANMSLQVSKDIPNIDIPDVTSVNVAFRSGAVGHLDCSFTQPDHRMGVEVLGKDFRVVLDGVNLSIVEKESTISYKSKVNFYEEQDQAFIAAIQAKSSASILSSYENGMKTLAVTLAANQSQKTGQCIDLKTGTTPTM